MAYTVLTIATAQHLESGQVFHDLSKLKHNNVMPKSDARLDLRSNQAYASQVAIPSIQNFW